MKTNMNYKLDNNAFKDCWTLESLLEDQMDQLKDNIIIKFWLLQQYRLSSSNFVLGLN